MIAQFAFQNPVRVVFGEGRRRELPTLAKALEAQRPLVVTDEGLLATESVQTVVSLLREVLSASVFSEVEPNPTVQAVERGLQTYRDGDCDGIIAIGGGSVMDAAKVIGIVAANGGSVADYEGVDLKDPPLPPLIAVPTTCGTGSEVTRFAMISDPSVQRKLYLFGPALFPKLALLDPELLYTLPAQQISMTGMDALSHAIESYTSRIPSPITDALNEAALALFHDNLLEGHANRSPRAMANLLIASALAGMAIGNTRGGLVHAISHPVTAWGGTPHGIANAILMPSVMRFNAPGAIERYSRIAQLLRPDIWKDKVSLDAALAAADIVEDLRARLGIPSMLSDVGVERDMVEPIVDEAMRGPQLGVNPREVTREDARRILSNLVARDGTEQSRKKTAA